MKEIALVIYFGMMLLGLGMTAAQNGQPKKGKENFIVSIIASIITGTLVLIIGGYIK